MSVLDAKWLEWIETITATCAQTGRLIFDFLTDAVTANFQSQSAPSSTNNNTSLLKWDDEKDSLETVNLDACALCGDKIESEILVAATSHAGLFVV